MDITKEIENLQNLRAWLMEHKSRLYTLNMLEGPENIIQHLDITIKRLRTTKKLCEAKQMKLL